MKTTNQQDTEGKHHIPMTPISHFKPHTNDCKNDPQKPCSSQFPFQSIPTSSTELEDTPLLAAASTSTSYYSSLYNNTFGEEVAADSSDTDSQLFYMLLRRRSSTATQSTEGSLSVSGGTVLVNQQQIVSTEGSPVNNVLEADLVDWKEESKLFRDVMSEENLIVNLPVIEDMNDDENDDGGKNSRNNVTNFSRVQDVDENDHDYEMQPLKLSHDHDRDQQGLDPPVSEQSTGGLVYNQSYFIICFIILIGDTARGITFPTLWPLVQFLGGSAQMQGVAVAAFSFGRVFAAPYFGRLSTQRGYFFALRISMSIMLLGTFMYSFSDQSVRLFGKYSVFYLIFAQFLIGIGSGTLGVTR